MTTDNTDWRDPQRPQPPKSAEADATQQPRTPPLSKDARWYAGAMLSELAASAALDDGPIGTRCRPIGSHEEESE